MLHLGSIRGTSIDIDFSFIFLVLFFVVVNYNPERGIHYALLWIPILFLAVLFHELAHAGMIGLLGFGSSRIILGGMGGATYNQRRARPWQDLLISVAGPAANFALWFVCGKLQEHVELVHTDRFLAALVPLLGRASLVWGIFNLIPLAPLDGGHATREFFRIFLSERNAFIIAIWIGIVVGSIAALLSLLVLKQIFLTLYLGWFVYMAFQQWLYFKEHGVPGD